MFVNLTWIKRLTTMSFNSWRYEFDYWVGGRAVISMSLNLSNFLFYIKNEIIIFDYKICINIVIIMRERCRQQSILVWGRIVISTRLNGFWLGSFRQWFLRRRDSYDLDNAYKDLGLGFFFKQSDALQGNKKKKHKTDNGIKPILSWAFLFRTYVN